MVERLITLNLRRYLVEQPVTKRQRKAVSYIRERVAHYTKIDIDNVKIDMPLSESVIKYYSRKMKPIKLSVDIKDGSAFVKAHQDSIRASPSLKVDNNIKLNPKDEKKDAKKKAADIKAEKTNPAPKKKSVPDAKKAE